MDSSENTQLILDRAELANDGYPPVKGQVSPNDVLIEFTVGGTGYGFPHKALRRFEVSGERVMQTDPIAPRPRDFVQEWLSASWAESAARSESSSLEEWHSKLHRDDGMGDFPDPAMRCTSAADLWQVATRLHEAPRHYYLIRWRQPYFFTMAGVSDRPFPDCTVADPQADEHPVLIGDSPD
jgi:hypothetical protein